jgi:hypothetical protein
MGWEERSRYSQFDDECSRNRGEQPDKHPSWNEGD